jgi:hypothetical protein
MGRLPDGARHLANRDVLQVLERQAKRAKPAYAAIDIDEYKLHTHPDVVARLAAAGAELDAPMVAVYEVPVLMQRNHVIFAIACGMDTLVFRLPANLHTHNVPSQWTADVGTEWAAATAPLSDLPSREAIARMREWSRLADEHAARLGRMGRP